MSHGLTAPTLQDIFNTAAEAVKAFPQLAKLYVGTVEDAVYVSPEAAHLLDAHVADVNMALGQRVDYMRRTASSGLAFSLCGTAPDGVNAILVETSDDTVPTLPRIYVSRDHPPMIDTITILDHEIGHHAVPEGRSAIPDPHLRECAADAFAALRHIQRFGNKTDYFSYAPFTRTRILVHGYTSRHYTTAVIHKIDSLKDTLDIASLSLQETAALAGKIARDYALSQETLQKITFAFQPVSNHFFIHDIERKDSYTLTPAANPDYFRAIFDVMHKYKDDHDIYRAGRQIVLHHMDAIKRESAPFFAEALAFMAEHEKTSGIILDHAAAIDAARVKISAKTEFKPGI